PGATGNGGGDLGQRSPVLLARPPSSGLDEIGEIRQAREMDLAAPSSDAYGGSKGVGGLVGQGVKSAGAGPGPLDAVLGGRAAAVLGVAGEAGPHIEHPLVLLGKQRDKKISGV